MRISSKRQTTTRMGAAALALALLAGLTGCAAHKDAARLDYDVVRPLERYEIRRYEPMVMAEVTISGDYDRAIKRAYKELKRYAKGANADAMRIPLTMPLMHCQCPETGAYIMWLPMPEGSSAATLPAPESAHIRLRNVPGATFVVSGFEGAAYGWRVKEETDKALFWIEKDKLVPAGGLPLIAQYNPRGGGCGKRLNEVMVQIRTKPPKKTAAE